MNVKLIVLGMLIVTGCGNNGDYLIRIPQQRISEIGDAAGYINIKGDTIIPIGKYIHCYNDTVRNFGVVMGQDNRLIGIDKDQNELFEVFWFDNGPDYLSDGLFRIVKNNKIGYADETGKIIIEPQFDCAYPFEKGVAKVSRECARLQSDEHSSWISDHWVMIDKTGKEVQ